MPLNISIRIGVREEEELRCTWWICFTASCPPSPCSPPQNLSAHPHNPFLQHLTRPRSLLQLDRSMRENGQEERQAVQDEVTTPTSAVLYTEDSELGEHPSTVMGPAYQ